MAETALPPQTIDSSSGFCSETRTFHSLRPPVLLPPPSLRLSVTDYVLSLLRSRSADLPPLASTAALIDATSGLSLSYSELLRRTQTLAASLRRSVPSLFPGLVAFILSPSSLHLPVLYLALLSLGVVLSPANPLSSAAEIARLLRLSKPSVAFSTRAAASRLPSFPLGTVLIDSPEFLSMMIDGETFSDGVAPVVVKQSDAAAILYSSGTTGAVKGALLTHRNFIAVVGGFFHNRPEDPPGHPVMLFTLPLFHIFGIFMLLRAVALGITSVIMEKFDFQAMLATIERFKVTSTLVSPPLVVALAKLDIVLKYDLSSLGYLGCGGAPLGEEVARKFKARFPDVQLSQGYGLTETGGGATRMIGPDECKHYGSAGRLAENTEAKIVDSLTGEALPPGQQGELWLRGPMTMKGYVGDDEATAAIIDPDGWLKTGDLCYFDSDGFLFVVDRLKELIKYKAYQVAPAELEHLLQSNPDIADAAVVPYPDEEAGQIPMAFVVRKPGSSITAAAVMDFVAKQVAPYKKIRRVAFINAIPKSPAGKILRRELVKQALSATSSKL